jgi:hypothetical protein
MTVLAQQKRRIETVGKNGNKWRRFIDFYNIGIVGEIGKKAVKK